MLIEISHFLSSIIGLVLMLLAFGLSRRLDGGLVGDPGRPAASRRRWRCSRASTGKSPSPFVVLVGLLAPCHEAFPRNARLSRLEITPGWLLSAVAAVAGAGLAGWWTFQHLDYANVSGREVMGDAGRRARPALQRRRRGGAARRRGLAPARRRPPRRRSSARTTRTSAGCARSSPRPRWPSPAPTWRFAATSVSCSPTAARAS